MLQGGQLLITNGLGGSGNGLITITLDLIFGNITIITPPQPNVGGGPVPISGFYVPFPKGLENQSRTVLITVRFSEKMTWRKSYNITFTQEKIIVRVINIINDIKNKVSIGVTDLKRNVSTVFAKINK